MFAAAIPVLAVTETASGWLSYFFSKAAMIARSSSDFPHPGHQ